MNVSMIIELPTPVHYQCAICNQTKSLEYLVRGNDESVSNICRECRDVVLRQESLKQLDSVPPWLTEEEIQRLGMLPIWG